MNAGRSSIGCIVPAARGMLALMLEGSAIYRLDSQVDLFEFNAALAPVMNGARDALDLETMLAVATRHIDASDLAGEPRPVDALEQAELLLRYQVDKERQHEGLHSCRVFFAKSSFSSDVAALVEGEQEYHYRFLQLPEVQEVAFAKNNKVSGVSQVPGSTTLSEDVTATLVRDPHTCLMFDVRLKAGPRYGLCREVHKSEELSSQVEAYLRGKSPWARARSACYSMMLHLTGFDSKAYLPPSTWLKYQSNMVSAALPALNDLVFSDFFRDSEVTQAAPQEAIDEISEILGHAAKDLGVD